MAERVWTRRRFVEGAAAAGALVAARPGVPWGLRQEALPPPTSQKQSPEIISGGLVPLLESNVARPMRYGIEGGAFTIHNGREFFNRPLYGPNIPFRVDGGDLPEFSLYLPGHGGNLRLGVATGTGEGLWLAQALGVTSRYQNGRLAYSVRDPLFGPEGVVQVEALVDGTSLCLEIVAHDLLPGLSLAWAFAGVSGRKGRRNGDIGCEVEPVSRFFQVRPEECRGNVWTLRGAEAEVASGPLRLRVGAPQGAELRVVDGSRWDAGWRALWESGGGGSAGELPALAGQARFGSASQQLRVEVLSGAAAPVPVGNGPAGLSASQQFLRRKTELAQIAGSVAWRTPDTLLNGIGPALGIAADAIWDEAQGCVMHGAVAWRIALAGWRGPYALDVMGRHDRMQRHLRHWMARQDGTPVTRGAGGVPTRSGFLGIAEARGQADKGSAGARSEGLLHSNGDLSHNHYDMNLVCFDALLRHLRWTGDLAFAREAWPALQRHAAWERRLFRRNYGGSGEQGEAPLYEAYAAIWASDNLQYNGGGAAHSSAYNVFLNREMAGLARLLGEDAVVAGAYAAEADAIVRAMNALLWMPERGAFAESREWLGERRLGESPAVWTVYHALDCELTTRKQAWQMAAERLRALRKVPVVGPGVPTGEGHAAWQLPCSDWLPYEWSLTLLCLGENLHTALALFQAGMAEQAHGLLRGALLDAAYRGLCPGNFPMSLQLDPHRQESQRDFADPIGCAARALLQGLWGVEPDLLAGRVRLRPQLPEPWESASLRHPELTMTYTRQGLRERWAIAAKFARPAALRLELKARTVELPAVTVNGKAATVAFDPEAVGSPVIVLESDPAPAWAVELAWRGEAPVPPRTEPIVCTLGEAVRWPAGVVAASVDDPQGCLREGLPARAGHHLVFAAAEHGVCRFSLPLELDVRGPELPPRPMQPQAGERFEPVSLAPHLTAQVREIFTRPHTAPRPGLCSLNLPEGLLGGWANFDGAAGIGDAGLRAAGGMLHVTEGLVFATPSNPQEPNCCFLSHWQEDRRGLGLPLAGRAHAVYLLLACTTFPQATRSLHGTARVRYADGASPAELELRSPATWWPVEQDYLIDDYVFRLEPAGAPEEPLPVRIDLATGAVRVLDRATLKAKGGRIPEGSATVLRLALDAQRELAGLELSCELYGVQMGVLAVTLGR